MNDLTAASGNARLGRARIRDGESAETARIAYGPLVMDMDAKRAFLNGAPLDLPRRQWSLLRTLLPRAARALSKNAIRRAVAGSGAMPSANAIEIHISRLRAKLKPAGIRIVFVRRLGYVICAEDDSHRAERF